MAKETKKVKKAKEAVFDTTKVSKMKKGSVMGNEYYDSFTRHRSSFSAKLVNLPVQTAIKMCYTTKDLNKSESTEIDISVAEMPIIDIIQKQSKGHEALVKAKNEGIDNVTVLIVADKAGQIDWFLDRKGIK